MIKKTMLAAVLAAALSTGPSAADIAPYQVVHDDKITVGEKENHINALVAFKKAWEETSSKMTYHFYDLDNGYVTAFSNVGSADYNAIQDKRWADHADQFDTDFLAENGKVYARSIEWQNHYVQRYSAPYSVAGDVDVEEYPYVVWLKMNLNGHKEAETIAAMKELAELDRAAAVPLHYRVYSLMAGEQLPKLNVFYFAKSEADFKASIDRAKKLRGEKGKALMAIIKGGMIASERITGNYLPNISY